MTELSAKRPLPLLLDALDASAEEKQACERLDKKEKLPFGVSEHFLTMMENPTARNDPLRMQVMPSLSEFESTSVEGDDPLGEKALEEVPNLVHRYPNRALLLVTDRCASYCRFCTRKRMVGRGPTPTKDDLRAALRYISEHDEIDDVILSGGDPLVLSDKRLLDCLSALRAIQSVKIVRLATRILTFNPSRITQELIESLKPYQPLYWMVHFNHVQELGAPTRNAISRLVDSGFSLLNQSVLLRGINDDADTLAALFSSLVELRVKPYYLHQCDLAEGTKHFRVPITRGQEIMKNLQGRLSGLALPQYILDVPGGAGKITLTPNRVLEERSDQTLYEGSLGHQAWYPK